jgi:cytochrome c peroxidase
VKVLLFLLISCSVFASKLDTELAQYIEQFKFQAVDKIVDTNPALTELGHRLFFDKRVSLVNKISCADCHHPDFGTGDALPFSIGVGGQGLGTNRSLHQGDYTSRNAPAVFNRGHKEFIFMFWDGRILVNKKTGAIRTPEPNLYGKQPVYAEIAKTLDSALAAQALFPMTSTVEMKGQENDHLTNKEVWDLVLERVLSVPEYAKLIKQAYPQVKEYNIGHIGNALAQFQKIQFQATETNWDKYLRGDLKSMTRKEKRGAIAFVKNRCANCHTGKHLTGMSFKNVASPMLGRGQTGDGVDLGRYLLNPKPALKYAYMVPALRNVSLSAPYFHNGALLTLEDVIEHYNDTAFGIRNYFPAKLLIQYYPNYYQYLAYNNDPEIVEDILKHQSPPAVMPLRLTEQEKSDLLEFLKVSLTDLSFRHWELKK